MDPTALKSRIVEAVVDFDMDHIEELTRDALDAGIPARALVLDGLSVGMTIVGERYASREYFLPELVMCAETMKLSMTVLEPYLASGTGPRSAGKVLIGTVAGDLHDIGKNIVASMLQGAGFEVHDLGVDVPTASFITHIRDKKPDIVGLSALLLTTREAMSDVISALREAGIRQEVKVIVGGCPITREYAEAIGADGYAADALEAVQVAKALLA